jgi:NRPS condensation-like uncharacterized protein
LIVLRVARGSLSIDRLLSALRFILKKYAVLRTSLVFNNEGGTVQQCITNNHQTFTFANKQTFQNENELNDIIYQTSINPNLFDLSSGRVLYCQILQQQNSLNKNKDNQLITDSDVLIIALHHAAADRSSSPIFLNDLCMAYNNNTLTMSINEETLQYIDYAIHEHLIDMTLSSEFWHSQLKGCNLEYPLSLPVDRYRSSIDHRSSFASVAQISFNNEISTAFFDYASSHQITVFQLGLAIFYVFLFKLTHGQNDLCIACLNANRYRSELQNMIGMFVATLPYRIQFDSHWSFDELVKQVRETCLSIIEHSYYPLQHILAHSHFNQSNVSFLETIFDFITVSSDIDHLSFNGARLEPVSLEQSSEVAKFDFMLTFIYNPTLNDGKLSCRFVCSRDLFDEMTVANIARRFQHLFVQVFSSKFNVSQTNQLTILMSKLFLILPEEAIEMQEVVFHRLPNINNEGMYISVSFLMN